MDGVSSFIERLKHCCAAHPRGPLPAADALRLSREFIDLVEGPARFTNPATRLHQGIARTVAAYPEQAFGQTLLKIGDTVLDAAVKGDPVPPVCHVARATLFWPGKPEWPTCIDDYARMFKRVTPT